VAFVEAGLVFLAVRAGLIIGAYDSKAHGSHSCEFLSMGTSVVAVSKLVGVVIASIGRMELFKATDGSGRDGEAIRIATQDLLETENCEREIVWK
jgi:hypothetical protein